MTHKRPVLKVLPENLIDNLAPYPGQYVLNTWMIPKIPLGRVALVLKRGKRPKLVTGTIESEPIEGLDYRLEYRYYFTPNNPEKLRKILA